MIMTNVEIGKKLVELCQQGKNQEAADTLYAKDIISVEAAGGPNMPAETRGIDAIHAKGKWWSDNHTVHSAVTEGPYPHGSDKFGVKFVYDVTNKPSNQRRKFEELAVYTVKDGKIVREEFYYAAG
jgi:hypothetical protein